MGGYEKCDRLLAGNGAGANRGARVFVGFEMDEDMSRVADKRAEMALDAGC